MTGKDGGVHANVLEPRSLVPSSKSSVHDMALSHDDPDQKRMERSLTKKLDFFLVTVLSLMCSFQAIDKSLISVAKIKGLEVDLNMTQHQYNIALGIFQIAYLILQLPSNMVISQLHPQIYLSLCCVLWSIVAACHSVITSYQQLLGLRFLLGFLDAPFLVGAIHMLSCWYTRRELAKRIAIIAGAITMSVTLMYPVSTGITIGLEGKNGWRGWRWLFLIFGCAGIGVAVLGVFMLPGYTTSTKPFWLSDDEFELARVRIQKDRINEKQVDKHKMKTGLIDALQDKRTWIFIVMFFARKAYDGLYYYLPTLYVTGAEQLVHTKTMSVSNLALLLGLPPAVIASVLAFLGAWSSEKYCERTYHIVVPLLLAFFGLTISVATPNAVARYVSTYLYLPGSTVGAGMAWAWVANVIQENPEKKASAIALVGVLGGAGGVLGPFLFRTQDHPYYRLAFAVFMALTVVDICACLYMRATLKKQNEQLDREGSNSEKYTL